MVVVVVDFMLRSGADLNCKLTQVLVGVNTGEGAYFKSLNMRQVNIGENKRSPK